MSQEKKEVCIAKSDYSNIDIDKLLAPLGGMEIFVKPGEKVLLKVNLLSATTPEKAVTTNPAMVVAVANAVKKAGGIPFIGDSGWGRFTKNRLEKLYENTGMKKVAEELEIELNYDTTYKTVKIKQGKKLKKAHICNFYLNADKTIALPKIKTHSLMIMTLATKIMYGVVPGLTKAKYHALYPKRKAFAEILIDILSVTTPDLYIMDGVIGMMGEGPQTGIPIELGVVLASKDAVAMDLAICEMLGIEPTKIPTLKRTNIRKMWPSEIEYPLLNPKDVKYTGFQMPKTTNKKLKFGPVVMEKCTACGKCKEICPKDVIKITEKAKIDNSNCIRCYCCMEVCPEDAIELVVFR